jgi:hypothetical protein
MVTRVSSSLGFSSLSHETRCPSLHRRITLLPSLLLLKPLLPPDAFNAANTPQLSSLPPPTPTLQTHPLILPVNSTPLINTLLSRDHQPRTNKDNHKTASIPNCITPCTQTFESAVYRSHLDCTLNLSVGTKAATSRDERPHARAERHEGAVSLLVPGSSMDPTYDIHVPRPGIDNSPSKSVEAFAFSIEEWLTKSSTVVLDKSWSDASCRLSRASHHAKRLALEMGIAYAENVLG